MSEVPSLASLPQEVSAGRTPQWSLSSLRHRPCPLCRDDRAQPVCKRPDGLLVARCGCCHMLYVPDVPRPDDIARFYRAYAQHRTLTSSRLPSWRLRRAARRDPYVEVLQASGGLRGRTVVEIGCSFGAFLELARFRGAVVRGVEIDEQAASHLASIGIPCSPRLEPAMQADVVCAFQVLEHLEDPASLLASVADALPEDGRLLLALPNGGEGERVGPAWIGYRVDLEHLNYFTVGTLSRLLMAHGLWVEQFWEHTQPAVPRPGHEADGIIERVRRRVHTFGQPATFASASVAEQGTFVLSALARKRSR